MSGWQPIKTAPKDGVPVKVFGPDPAHGKNYIGPAVWNGFYWRKLHRPGFVNMIAYPTHWMDLEPPETGK